jgi:hypothetical protein
MLTRVEDVSSTISLILSMQQMAQLRENWKKSLVQELKELMPYNGNNVKFLQCILICLESLNDPQFKKDEVNKLACARIK